MTELLGLPLDLALEICLARGLAAPDIVQTRAPRRAVSEGTLRVVRVDAQGARLFVARFPDILSAEGGGAS